MSPQLLKKKRREKRRGFIIRYSPKGGRILTTTPRTMLEK
jgi:hypothetical protein